jgi:hypothetical protein
MYVFFIPEFCGMHFYNRTFFSGIVVFSTDPFTARLCRLALPRIYYPVKRDKFLLVPFPKTNQPINPATRNTKH